MATHLWNGHTITVGVRLMPKCAWLLAQFYVRVDGSGEVRCKGLRNGLGAPLPFEIPDPGGPIHGELRTSKTISAYSGITYSIHVGEQRLDGRAYADNGWILRLLYIIPTCIGLGVMLLATTAFFLKTVMHPDLESVTYALTPGNHPIYLLATSSYYGIARAISATEGQPIFSLWYWETFLFALFPLLWLRQKIRAARIRRRDACSAALK